MDAKTLLPARGLTQVVRGVETSDGAGVRLTRVIGQPRLDMLDPFLLLDAFRSDDPEDYIAGFPPHPHRGFETVTYLLHGRMRHRDSAGHAGTLVSGSVQWMTAGRGVIHSEMPEQEEGLLYGFQLWVNLPAAKKMLPPRYQEFGPEAIAVERRDGAELRVVAGTSSRGTRGPVTNVAVDPLYFDVSLAAGGRLEEPVPDDHNAFVYLIEGELSVAGGTLLPGQLGILGPGGLFAAEARAPSRFLLVAGRPLNEPVARRGPFVMNTQQELMQAFRDYSEGRLAPELS